MKRFFTWKVFRRLLIGLAVLVTLVAVVWAIENFRGHRAWANHRAELEAKGEKVDLQSFVPPRVPDAKNFALASHFKELDFSSPGGNVEPDVEVVRRKLDAYLGRTQKEVPSDRDRLNLKAHQEFYRGNEEYPQPAAPGAPARDVLVALSKFDAEFEQLHRDATERPLARFPIRYEDGMQVLLPHLNVMKNIVSTLRLRGTCYLELDRSDDAFRDAQLAMRVTDSIKEEPLLISYLVRGALVKLDTLFLKEGIVRHAWKEEHLQQFQNYFQQTDLLKEYHRAIRGERAFSLDLMEDMARGEYTVSQLIDPMSGSTGGSDVKWFLPVGWLKQNMRHISLMHEEITLPAVDPAAGRVYPETVTRGEANLAKVREGIPNPHNIFAPLLLPAVISVAKRTAEHQTAVDLAMLACALERYYLVNKNYPDSLQDLVPQFVQTLPHDVVTGAPLKYQRTDDGFYRLYSVGWDGNDDGGKPRPESNQKEAHDWLWHFAAAR